MIQKNISNSLKIFGHKMDLLYTLAPLKDVTGKQAQKGGTANLVGAKTRRGIKQKSMLILKAFLFATDVVLVGARGTDDRR